MSSCPKITHAKEEILFNHSYKVIARMNSNTQTIFPLLFTKKCFIHSQPENAECAIMQKGNPSDCLWKDTELVHNNNVRFGFLFGFRNAAFIEFTTKQQKKNNFKVSLSRFYAWITINALCGMTWVHQDVVRALSCIFLKQQTSLWIKLE